MAYYLSRHPSEFEDTVTKSEGIFNDWFIISVVNEITPKLKRLARTQEPIKSRETRMAKQKISECVLTIHTPLQTNHSSAKEKS